MSIKKSQNATLPTPETHYQGNTLRDVILGGQDGLVNVLGVIFGASAATSDPKIIIGVSLAATFAETLSMTAVAYTSFKSEKEHYESELAREKWEIEELPERETEEIREIYQKKGFKGDLLNRIVKKIVSDKQIWLDIMMSEELGFAAPMPWSAVYKTTAVVGISTLLGSLVPLFPYFIFPQDLRLVASVLVSALVLFGIGFYKAKVMAGKYWRSALEMMFIGLIAAVAGYAVSLLFTRGYTS